MNATLRIEITDKAQTHIAVAAAWRVENRSAAPDALAKSLIAFLVYFVCNRTLEYEHGEPRCPGCEESHSLEFGTTCTTE